jgi:hypothetical protein
MGLVRDGIVTRTIYPTNPLQVEYGLTERGHSMSEPILAFGACVRETVAFVAELAISEIGADPLSRPVATCFSGPGSSEQSLGPFGLARDACVRFAKGNSRNSRRPAPPIRSAAIPSRSARRSRRHRLGRTRSLALPRRASLRRQRRLARNPMPARRVNGAPCQVKACACAVLRRSVIDRYCTGSGCDSGPARWYRQTPPRRGCPDP